MTDAVVPTPRTGVVVVNHDTRDELIACLDSLATVAVDHVVVVDSGSKDGSVAAVRAAHPQVEVLALPNVGYGRAANAGVARCGTEVVVIANADTRFTAGSVGTLARALAEDGSLGAVGPRVVYPDGRHQASARTVPSLGTALGHALLGLWWPSNPWTSRYRMTGADPAAPRDVDWLSGCVVAVRREAFVDVDGFDPAYFMFVEDVDLGRRLAAAGWRLRYRPDSRVVHTVGASTGRAPARMVVEHARSLDTFYGTTYGRHRLGRLARPLVRAGLGLWATVAVLWGQVVGRRSGRSSTGE